LDNSENKKEILTEEPQQTSQPQAEVQYYYSSQAGEETASSAKPKKKMPVWLKSVIIICIIILAVVLLATGCNSMLDKITGDMFHTDYAESDVTTDFGHDYIGTVYVEGEMSEEYAGSYNHEYILNSIDAMIDDPENKGLILYVDTPGGTVFSADELYFKIKEYKEETGRPVYSSMQGMAASGGYYVSAPCDKIIANRNCWTGSIGVTLGTFVDVSQLLEDMGIRTVTIASGDNKGMGSSMHAMTQQQKDIYQSLVDEAYDQFVGIVCEGRQLDDATVRKLADGRIYSAKQALENKMVDAIGSLEEAKVAFAEQNQFSEDITYFELEDEMSDFWNGLFSAVQQVKPKTELELAEDIMENRGNGVLKYYAK